MNDAPQSYEEKLKGEFTASEKFKGYDADEDQGYFIEWLVQRLWESEGGTRSLAAIMAEYSACEAEKP